ncbi:MAG: shikimate kinase [Pseudonocardiales bacterium]
MTRPVVVLVGPPGAGKSSVGRLLADRLGVALRDTDADVAAAAGKDIPAIFYDDGEPRFRELESAAVATALSEHAGVLALGGGAVLAEATREALRGHTVVFLDVGMAATARRVGLARDRPVLTLNPRAMLHALLAERRPLYEQVATRTVGTDDRTPSQVADAVLEALR